MIIEPLVQGAGGMRFHSPEILAALRAMAKKHDVLFIADEIATGFWRTGHRFACEAADVRPDILCLGKALTGGTITMGATLATRGDLRGVPERRLGRGPDARPHVHGQSAGLRGGQCLARPVRARAEGRAGQADRGRPARGLEPCRAMPGVVDVRVRGAIGVVQLDAGVDVYASRPRFVEQGVWVRPFKDIVYLMPPLVIEDDDLDILTRAVRTRPERAVMPDFALLPKEAVMTNAARSIRFVFLVPIVLCATARGGEPVTASVETTLTTREDHIRQLAFDGVATTFFASRAQVHRQGSFHARPRQAGDVKSIDGDRPGRPDDSETVADGKLEVSPDGQSFHELARFHRRRRPSRMPSGNPIRAIRIKPGAPRTGRSPSAS